MKPLVPLLAVLLAASAPTFAGPCVALDYQEMKDMTVNDLVTEACKTNKTKYDNYDQAISLPTLSPAWREADRDFDQCKGQLERMERILASKGLAGKLADLCKLQAQGQTITAPAEAK